MDPVGDQSASPAFRKFALLLLLTAFLLIYYTILNSSMFRVDDEHILASRAISLQITGDLSDNQVYGNQRVRELYELGDAATEIEPAQAVLSQPFLWLVSFFPSGWVQSLFLLTILLTAGTAFILSGIVLELGYSLRTAAWTALLFGMATTAAAYADTFYRDPQAMFFSTLTLYFLLSWFRSGRLSSLIFLFGAFGAAVLTKNNMLALLPAILMGGLFELPAMRRGGNWPAFRRSLILLASFLVLGGAAVFILPEKGVSSRFSSDYYLFLLDFFRDSLTPGFLIHAAGPFLSPAKSIFLFSPVLLAAVPGAVRMWQKQRSLTITVLLFCAGTTVAQALFFRGEWAGTFGWGLRFMLPTLPAMMVFAADPVERWLDRTDWKRFLPFLFLAAGTIINFSGSVVNWRVPYRIWIDRGLVPFQPEAVWQGKYLAIPYHLGGLLHISDWSPGWLRVHQGGASAGLLIPGMGIVLMVGTTLLIRRMLSKGPFRFRETILTGLLGGVGLVFPFFPGLWAAQADPYWCARDETYQQALVFLQDKIQEGDVLVFDSYGTDHWHCLLNDWTLPQPWYSLGFEIPGPSAPSDAAVLSEYTLELFQTFPGRYQRIWYVETGQAPDFGVGQELRWLKERYAEEISGQFEVSGDQIRIGVFSLAGN